MKKLLEKLFFWNAPAHGALFAAVLILISYWLLILLVINTRMYWLAGGIFAAELIYLLITGSHFGWRYRKELSFANRWKWQIPATCCWILLLFPVLRVLNMVCGVPALGKWLVYLSYSGFLATFAGIFCTGKIIEKATDIPLDKLFGKGACTIIVCALIIALVTAVMVY